MKDFIESIRARTRTWSTKQSTNGWIMVELSIVLTARCPPTVRPSFRSCSTNALVYTREVAKFSTGVTSHGPPGSKASCIHEQNDRVDHMSSRNQTSLAVEMEPVQNYPHVLNGPLELVVSPRCQQL